MSIKAAIRWFAAGVFMFTAIWIQVVCYNTIDTKVLTDVQESNLVTICLLLSAACAIAGGYCAARARNND